MFLKTKGTIILLLLIAANLTKANGKLYDSLSNSQVNQATESLETDSHSLDVLKFLVKNLLRQQESEKTYGQNKLKRGHIWKRMVST